MVEKCTKGREISTEPGVPIFRNEAEDRIIVKPSLLVKYCSTKCSKFEENNWECCQKLIDLFLEAKSKC